MANEEPNLDLSDGDLLLVGRARKALEKARVALAARWGEGAVTCLLMGTMVADLDEIMTNESWPGQPEIIRKQLTIEGEYLRQRDETILAALDKVTKTKPA